MLIINRLYARILLRVHKSNTFNLSNYNTVRLLSKVISLYHPPDISPLTTQRYNLPVKYYKPQELHAVLCDAISIGNNVIPPCPVTDISYHRLDTVLHTDDGQISIIKISRELAKLYVKLHKVGVHTHKDYTLRRMLPIYDELLPILELVIFITMVKK